MIKKKFSSLQELREEKLRLKQLCDEKEEELTERLQYIQENLGSLVLTSLLPKKDALGGIVGKVAGFFTRFSPGLEGKVPEKFRPAVKIAEMLAAGLVYRFVRRIFRKKEHA